MARRAIVPSATMGAQADPGWSGPEAASQTWKAGALLTSTAGLLVEASANPRSIIGVAAEDASGVTSKEVRYYPIGANNIFEITLDKAAGLGTRAIAAADLYSEFGVTLNTGVWYLDIDKTTGGTNTTCLVVGFLDVVGAIQGDTPNLPGNNSGHARVLVTFLQEVNVLHSA